MKLKKVIALLLVSVMSVGILAACGNNNTDSTPPAPPVIDTAATGDVDAAAVEEIQAGYVPWDFGPHNPVTISMWIVGDDGMPAADNKIVNKIRDELGVTLDIEVTIGENQDTRIGTMLAGGQFPDIMASTHNDALMTAGGAYLRLDDYLATGNWPLLREHVEPYLSQLSYRGGEVPTGLYQFPNFNRWYGPQILFIDWSAPGFWIQKIILEEAGYPCTITMTFDEYFQLIEDYAAANPTIDGVPVVPFTFNWNPHSWSVTNNALHLQGGANWGGAVPIAGTHTAKLYITDQYSYRWAKKLNELNAKGLLDAEAFTLTGDQFQARLASGAVLGFPAQRWQFGQGQDALVAEGRYERTYVPVPLTFDDYVGAYSTGMPMNIHQGWGISVDAENPEMLLDFIELMMTNYWQNVLFWGIEGEDYLVDADGIFYRTQEMRDLHDDAIWQLSNQFRIFRSQMPKREGVWPDGNAHSPGFQAREYYEGLVEYDRNFLAAYGYQYWRQFYGDPVVMQNDYPYYPIWQMNGMLSQAASDAITLIDETQYPYYARLALVNPDDFDALWDEFVAAVELAQPHLYLDEINAIIQDILARQ